MHPMLNIAIRVVRQAGDIIIRSADSIDTLKITIKSQNDFATEIDQRAENEIIKAMKEGKLPGRPRLAKGQARDRVISIKVRGCELAWLLERAKEGKVSLSQYVRRILFDRHREASR